MKVYHNSFFAMGSRFNIVLPFEEDAVCERLFYSVEKEVRRIEAKLSYFDEKSVVSDINKNAFKSIVKLDDEMFKIINTSLNYSEKTFHAFDITMRPVIERVLKSNKTNDLKSRLDEIILDEENSNIHFKSEKVKIDFGGFGKGYALERIKPIIENSPTESAFISFGESSILTKGKHPSGKKWSVGIKDFFNSNHSLHTFELENESISSSSNYYTSDSGQIQKKVNVINPYTLTPIDELGIMSVKSPSPLEAEILSTALFVLNDSQIQKAICNFKNLEVAKIFYYNNKPEIKYYN